LLDFLKTIATILLHFLTTIIALLLALVALVALILTPVILPFILLFGWIDGYQRKKGKRPITQDDIDIITQRKKDTERPVVKLIPITNTSPGALDTKLGGLPWGKMAECVWPISKTGDPMCFLGQVNFAQMPPIAGFPDRGLLQLFAFMPEDDDWGYPGHRYDIDQRIDHLVRWFPDADGPDVMARPDNLSSFVDKYLYHLDV